jgi:hypothetical protein
MHSRKRSLDYDRQMTLHLVLIEEVAQQQTERRLCRSLGFRWSRYLMLLIGHTASHCPEPHWNVDASDTLFVDCVQEHPVPEP